MADRIRRNIDAMAGDDGWWHTSNADTFDALARRLIAAGVDETEALDILATAHRAVADEFGAG